MRLPGGPVLFLYIGYLTVTVLVQALIGYWVYTHQFNRNGARWFLVMVGTGLVWVLGMVLFLLPVATPVRRGAYLVAVCSSGATITAFVAFVSTYTGRDFHRSRPVQSLLVAPVGAFALLAVTNTSHRLLYREFRPVAVPFPHLAVEPGPALVPILGLIYALALYSLYLLSRHLLSTTGTSRFQFALAIIAALTIYTLDLLSRYTAVMPVDGFTHAAFGTLPFYLLMAVSLYRFGLFDVKPIARKTVVESLEDPVVVIDDRGRVVDYNGAARRVWPTIAGRGWERFESACPNLAETVTIPPDCAITERLTLTDDGQERHYSVTVSPVSKGGDRRTGWYSVLLRDITELERSRWQLERQNERLDQVASTISHDLRNPLLVSAGNVAQLERGLDRADIDPDIEAELRDAATTVAGTTTRMQEIIDDVLTIAREGKTVEETERVTLASVARDAWANVTTHDATLTVDDDALQADRSKLMSIFENVFRNAIDHGPADVTVRVEATPEGFAIGDDGPGIPEQHRESIFEYGYTSSADGTGLGLSIVRTMAESHGWTVDHDDDYGAGTRLVFTGVSSDREPTPSVAGSDG